MFWNKENGGKAAAAQKAADALAAMDRVQAMIWFNVDGTILDANDNFLNALGYRLDEVRGQHHRMFVDPAEAAQASYTDFWKALAAGELATGEFRRFNKRGEEIWIEASYNPIFDESGKPVKVLKFAIDITEKKRKAADDAGQLAAISKSEAVIEFDLDGTIRHANENFLAATGYRLDEITGHHHRMFVEPGYGASAEYADFWRSLRNGEFKSGEFQRFGKGGDEIWIQATYNPIVDANGKPFKVVKFATDITARKQAVSAFEVALDCLSTGDLSHRIPMSVDGDFAGLRDGFNTTMTRLQDLVANIRRSAETTSRSCGAINDSAYQLSQRVESQASSLQEVAATMEEMAESIASTAENAGQAEKAAGDAAERATRGAEVVNDAIKAMDRIESSATKISDIISVIEAIAFQTNLLALNAAVEAARAGDAGKGFAVVASEVRILAQRSSEAAKDITSLINDSTTNVTDGAQLVNATGKALEEINSTIEAMVGNVAGISSASREQATGAREVSAAINSMDEATQQNSAMAEQSATNARSLSEEARELTNHVSFFSEETEAVRAAA